VNFVFSGHGAKIRDDDWDEEKDGYDETLVPVDYQEEGMIRDDDLYDILIKPLPEGVHMTCIMDCCHSGKVVIISFLFFDFVQGFFFSSWYLSFAGTVLDLPYVFKANGQFEQMEIDEKFDFDKLLGKFGGTIEGLLQS
jgi:hypothetical protein